MVDTIIKYLQHPMKVGVYNHISIIDFSGISDYLDGLLGKYKETQVEAKQRRLPKRILEERLARLEEARKKLTEKKVHVHETGFFEIFIETMGVFCKYSDECSEEMKDIFTSVHKVGKSSIRLPTKTKLFDSHIIPSVNDVIVIEKRHAGERKWLFDASTIKKDGLLDFEKKLEYIPPIKENLEVKKDKQHFSTRYVFRPYPWAVRLWLQDAASITIPDDLKSFLSGAIRYIFSSEWRTSIVLSAIAIESILADLYEEEYKEPAPDTPLGDLFKRVSDKMSFPSEIVKAVNMTNNARIAAVHRSRFPVSDREASNALFGATNFILWCHSQF